MDLHPSKICQMEFKQTENISLKTGFADSGSPPALVKRIVFIRAVGPWPSSGWVRESITAENDFFLLQVEFFDKCSGPFKFREFDESNVA